MPLPPEPSNRIAAAPRRRARRHRLLRLVAGILVVLTGFAVFLGSAPGKTLVLGAVSAYVGPRLGVQARADRLEYRILSRGVTLYGVSITRHGAARPLLDAERVEVDFTPGILFGALAIRRLDVTRPTIVVDATTRGTVAAPGADTATPDPLPAFNLQRVDLRDLALTIQSGVDTQVSVRGLSLALAGEGPGTLRGQAVVAAGVVAGSSRFTMRLDRARGDVSLVGNRLSLGPITADSAVAAVTAAGHLDISRGDLDLTYRAGLSIDHLHQWWAAAPPIGGTVDASGTIGGTLEDPVVTFNARGERLRWSGVSDASLTASGRWSHNDLVIDPYEVASRAAGTHVTGRLRLGAENGEHASSVRAHARVDDAGRLARLIEAPDLPAMPVTLTAELAWPGQVPSPATLGGTLRIAAFAAGSPGPSLATLEVSGADRRWTLRHRGTLAGDTGTATDLVIVLDPTALSRSTIGGRVEARSASLAEALLDLRRRGIAWANVGEAVRGGRGTLDGTVAGTVTSPRLEANVSADALTIAGIDEVRLDAQVLVDERSIGITRMTAESPGNRIDAQGTVTLGTGAIDLAVDGRLERPDAIGHQLPARWQPTGSVAFAGRLGGSWREPLLTARVTGAHLSANGVVADTLAGGVSFARGVLSVSELRLDRGDGWLRLDGDFDPRLDRLSVRGRGEKLDVAVQRLTDEVRLQVAGSPASEALRLEDLSLEFDVTGSWGQPSGTLSAATGQVAVEGRQLGPASVAANGSDGTVRINLTLPNHGADANGSIGLARAGPFEAHVNLRESPIAPLVSLLGLSASPADSSGTLSASIDLAGRLDRPYDAAGSLSMSALEGSIRGKPLTLAAPARLRFEGRRAIVETPFRLTLGGFAIGLAAPTDAPSSGDIVATAEGRMEEALTFLPSSVAVGGWLVDGPVRARISLHQAAAGFEISGDAEATVERLMRDSQEIGRDVRLRAQIRNSAIEVTEVGGTVLGGPFSGTGRIPMSWALPSWVAASAVTAGGTPTPSATLSARADVTLATMLHALAIKRDDVSGSAQVAIEAYAEAPRLQDVEATVSIEAGELHIDKVPLTQQRATKLRFRSGRLEFTELAWKGPRAVINASGTIGLLPGADGEFRAEGTTVLSFFRTIAPGANGQAAFQVRLSGPPGARRATATADLSDVSLIDPHRQLALAGVSGRLTLDGDVLETQGLRGQLNGGELTIEGGIPVRAGVVPPRPLEVEGRGLFVEVPRGLRSQLDTTLRWEQAATGPRLAGQVSISSDTYREPITALATLVASLSHTAPARTRTIPAWIAETALDVHITSTGPVVVDQSVLNVELTPDVRLTGTVGRPSLTGQVAIEDDGRITAGGRTYRLMESRLEFSPSTGLLPRLNVIGETRVSSYLVTLRLTGAANEIETNFSSDPPLSERDVRSLLVTGQTSDPVRGTTNSDRFAVGAVSGDVLGIAGHFVGLDSVRVGTEDLDLVSSDVNPSTRLTVSKRLGARFELVLSQDLEESESTWIVIYRPVSGYEFRLSSEDNTTQSFEFRQEITFGPGAAAHTRARGVTAVHDRIRSVSLAGEPGFTAAEVLGATAIRPGDRFDFREWLNDRDRIVRFYRARGYFTARVVPMRAAGEHTGKERPVDLQYRITRGRRTLLELTGYAADEALMQRLQQAWSDTVLLDLLGDSLTRAARDHLVDAGFLRARIEVDVDRPEPDTARARLRIQPGPRTETRQLAFSGNTTISSEALQQLASARRSDFDPWKDPAPLMDEIRAAYAAKGHLAARATAAPVEFSNGTATLPIHIDEGAPAQVASLQLTGVAPPRREGAVAAIALPTGSPFASGTERSARTRLERHYRNLGYRDVRVDVTATASPQGNDVVLTYAVTEGPLHVVRTVDVAGVQSTRASLVDDAVGVQPGKPAGAAEAAATERRLYELGTFRRAEVRFEPEPEGPSSVPGTVPVKAIVLVEEARRFQLRYGIELSSEYSSALSQRTNAWGLAADIRDRNFLGRGMSLGGGLRYEPDLRSVRTLFAVPRLAGRPIRTNVYLTGRGEEESIDQQVRVRDDEIELSVEQRWRFGRAVDYSWGYSVNWRDTQLVSVAHNEPLAFAGTLASLNGAAVIDRRDSFFDATRGWFGSASLQWGQREFGSDLDYLRTLVRGSYYQPFGPIVLAGNAKWGRLRPLGGLPPLTVFDLFFNAGGTESVRGYSQDELSAYEFFDAPLGGTKLLVVNGEIRTPLFWRLGGVLFADAGNTFTEQNAIRFRDLAVGVGFGLRINTPLAPVRIDLGFPRSYGKSGPRWHFSIGQMF